VRGPAGQATESSRVGPVSTQPTAPLRPPLTLTYAHPEPVEGSPQAGRGDEGRPETHALPPKASFQGRAGEPRNDAVRGRWVDKRSASTSLFPPEPRP